jgi:hypothetical protein
VALLAGFPAVMARPPSVPFSSMKAPFNINQAFSDEILDAG